MVTIEEILASRFTHGIGPNKWDADLGFVWFVWGLV